jgi:hypothetical protein
MILTETLSQYVVLVSIMEYTELQLQACFSSSHSP